MTQCRREKKERKGTSGRKMRSVHAGRFPLHKQNMEPLAKSDKGSPRCRLKSRIALPPTLPGLPTGPRTYFRLRLSCTTHSTSSQRQFPQGAPSTTSHRTLRARQDTQARAARRLVALPSPATEARFFEDDVGSVAEAGAGGGDMELACSDDDRGEGVSP